MTFALGARSRAELAGVHPRLAAVVERAIALTPVDFSVHDGLRTKEEQRALVARGASKTMASKHRRQADGFGHAVDLVPFVGGKLRWEWPLIYPVADAVDRAAAELDVSVRWGGVWDRPMSQIGGTPDQLKAAVAAYSARHPGPDFLDGPHFELLKP